MSRSRRSSRRGSHDRRAEKTAPPHLDRVAAHRRDRGHLHRLHAAVTFTPKWKFDAVLAAIVATWFFGGRALFRGPDLDVFLVQASAILTFLFLSAAISLGPLARLWRPATSVIYNRRHLGVTTWALAMLHAGFVLHYGSDWKLSNLLEVLPGQRLWGVPFTLFVKDTAPAQIYTLSLHDALPI